MSTVLCQFLRTTGSSLLLLLCVMPATASAWSWQDLWKTPHQQRQALEQSGDYNALIGSDSAAWKGVGQYRSGEFAAAAESYAGSEEISSQYNEATALTQAGDYDAAIEKFDDVLKQDPEHASAAHNQQIARQLKELQQQQNQNQDQGENQNSDQQQDENGQQDQSQQQDQQDQQNEQSESEQQQDESSQSGQQDQQSESQQNQQNSDENQADAEQQAQQEQQQSEPQEQEQQEAESAAEESDQPLSEDQQAIEQWLRKIPDDPSGLLRRKLIRSHQRENPDIRDSQSPW